MFTDDIEIERIVRQYFERFQSVKFVVPVPPDVDVGKEVPEMKKDLTNLTSTSTHWFLRSQSLEHINKILQSGVEYNVLNKIAPTLLNMVLKQLSESRKVMVISIASITNHLFTLCELTLAGSVFETVVAFSQLLNDSNARTAKDTIRIVLQHCPATRDTINVICNLEDEDFAVELMQLVLSYVAKNNAIPINNLKDTLAGIANYILVEDNAKALLHARDEALLECVNKMQDICTPMSSVQTLTQKSVEKTPVVSPQIPISQPISPSPVIQLSPKIDILQQSAKVQESFDLEPELPDDLDNLTTEEVIEKARKFISSQTSPSVDSFKEEDIDMFINSIDEKNNIKSSMLDTAKIQEYNATPVLSSRSSHKINTFTYEPYSASTDDSLVYSQKNNSTASQMQKSDVPVSDERMCELLEAENEKLKRQTRQVASSPLVSKSFIRSANEQMDVSLYPLQNQVNDYSMSRIGYSVSDMEPSTSLSNFSGVLTKSTTLKLNLEFKEKEERLNEIKAEIRTLKEDIETQANRLAYSKRCLDENNAKKEKLDNNIKELKLQLDEGKTKYSELYNKIQITIQQCKEEITRITESCKTANSKNMIHQQLIGTLTTEYENYKKHNNELEEELRKIGVELEEEKVYRDNYQTHCQQSKDKLTDFNNSRLRLLDNIQNIKQEDNNEDEKTLQDILAKTEEMKRAVDDMGNCQAELEKVKTQINIYKVRLFDLGKGGERGDPLRDKREKLQKLEGINLEMKQKLTELLKKAK